MTQERGADFVTIVSGLPRSGTSMMMRMLDAGGVPVVVDSERRPNDDNPLGYYEFEPVKALKDDATWLDDALGAAVKVIYLLLYDLPDAHRYRIVFMRRTIDEVLRSQEVMLQRSGAGPLGIDAADLAEMFAVHLQQIEDWMSRQEFVSVLYVDYADAVSDPAGTARRVAEFLGGGLDVGRMAAAVDPGLYRQRSVEVAEPPARP